MRCPCCYEQFTLIEAVKAWLNFHLPDWWYKRRFRLDEDTELAKLKQYYSTDYTHKLTAREHLVCQLRVNSLQSLDDIARRLNVTRERVRQIQAKALRKLIKLHE